MRFREGLGIQTGDPFAERGPLPTADTIFNIKGPLPVADTIFKVQGSLPMAEQHLRDNKNSGISKAGAAGCGNGGQYRTNRLRAKGTGNPSVVTEHFLFIE